MHYGLKAMIINYELQVCLYVEKLAALWSQGAFLGLLCDFFYAIY